MWKKYDRHKIQDPKDSYSNTRREFNSPRNVKTMQTDYNSYMLMKKFNEFGDKIRSQNIKSSKKY